MLDSNVPTSSVAVPKRAADRSADPPIETAGNATGCCARLTRSADSASEPTPWYSLGSAAYRWREMTAPGLGGEKVTRPILGDFLGAVPTVPAQLLLGELKRSEARAAGILDSALDCIVMVDHENCITEFNATAVRTFG